MKKKAILWIVALIVLVGVGVVGSLAVDHKENHRAIPYSEVPGSVKDFLGRYFAGETVKSVRADFDEAVTEYDIVLSNGVKVEIDANGIFDEITTRNAAIPAKILPDTVQAYLAANYANIDIVKIENDHNGYEVKLSNRTEVKFDPQGNFIKIDR